MILLLGNSDLANALVQDLGSLHDCIIAGRPEYDFSLQTDCDRILVDYAQPDIVINTMATISADWWQNLVVDFVAPCYLTLKYYQQLTHGHIINISSASAWWPSYPDLNFDRFTYNMGKESLSQFGKHLNRIVIDQEKSVTVSTIEPGLFQSRMSRHQGMDIGLIVDCVKHVIDHKAQHISLVR